MHITRYCKIMFSCNPLVKQGKLLIYVYIYFFVFPDFIVPEGLHELCALPMKIGTCRAAFPRYFFNIHTMECEMFIYGGCDGNDNNFGTEAECHQACAVDKS